MYKDLRLNLAQCVCKGYMGSWILSSTSLNYELLVILYYYYYWDGFIRHVLATSWSKSGFFKLLWFIMSVFVMSAFNAVTNSYEMKLHQTSKQVVQLFLNWHLPTIIIWMSMALVTKYVVSACSIYFLLRQWRYVLLCVP